MPAIARVLLPRLRVGLMMLVAVCADGCAAQPAQSVPVSRPFPVEARGADAIVVLGHRPPLADGVADTLEYETRARVEQGIALFRAGRAARLLFSGGPSTQRAIEADVMASYAVQHGVPGEALLRERESLDTIANARLSVALLRRELSLARRPRIVLVTSDYHLERAARLFRCAGAEVEGAAVPLVFSADERRRRARSERHVRLYYRFIDECKRAGGP